jgi:hypothetical protein
MLVKFKHWNKFNNTFHVRWSYCKERGRAEKIETRYINESKNKGPDKIIVKHFKRKVSSRLWKLKGYRLKYKICGIWRRFGR